MPVDEDSLTIVEPRRRGRPRELPNGETGSAITTWVPTSTHDRLIKMAEKQDVTVSRLVRTLLTIRVNRA